MSLCKGTWDKKKMCNLPNMCMNPPTISFTFYNNNKIEQIIEIDDTN